MMRSIYVLLFLMFSGFVLLQFNDPDPILWIVLYGYIAVLFAMAAFNKYNKYLIIAALVIYFAGMAYLFPSVIEWMAKEHGKNFMQSMNNEKMYIEESRECAGLAICFACSLLLFFQSRKATLSNKTV